VNQPTPLRQHLEAWALILGLWSLLVLAVAGQLVFTTELPWRQAFTISLRDWFPWVVLAPIVAWLAFRFPLERPKLVISVPVHLVACMLAVLVCDFLTRPNPQNLPQGGPQFRYRGGAPAEPPPPRGQPSADFPPEGLERPFPPPGVGARPAPFLHALAMRARFNVPIYWVIVSIVHALAYSRRSRERELKAIELEARLGQAKLDALRMQLHPHFLFNTLNAISTLVHRDPNAADEMIGNLSELLRATLDSSEQEIPLRQELEFLDRYLDIQKVRFGDRLRLAKEIDATALEARVPTLILQPLVENAVRHGIEPQTGVGLVQIRVRRDGDALRVSVHDNGAGPKTGAPQREGIGLANTRQRLEQLYGKQAHLTLTTSDESGFNAELEIPFHESPAAQSNQPVRA
jgi:two-component system, LytTR family, sensor kinase